MVDEAWRTGSFAAEVVTSTVEGAFDVLASAPVRLCSAEVPIPYPRHLEDAALPRVSAIVEGARRLVRDG